MNMQDVRTFKTYNFVTGAVDGTLAYDFSSPLLYPEEQEEWPAPEQEPEKKPAKKQRTNRREWIREEPRRQASAAAVERNRQGISVVSLLGAICAVVLITLMLLAQIRLADISNTTAGLEKQISELESQRTKLTVEYETIFNLKDVEEQAMDILGMQEPEESQIVYLSGVASADKAVVVTQEQTDLFSLGVKDIISSIKAYFS